MPRLRIRQNILLKIILAALVFMVITSPYLPVVVQTAWQGASASFLRRHYRHWPNLETVHFAMYYAEADADLALRLGREADVAAKRVAEILPHRTDGKKPWLILVPDQDSLKQVFGWGEGTGALGVYMCDTMMILSPKAWDWHDEDKRLEFFLQQAPFIHEYTHYVLDLRTKGNNTRWFSEGLSQHMEYNILGYEWLEEGSSLSTSIYTLDELDRSFDSLPSDALAYRQSLSMITYLESLQGIEGLNELIEQLGKGVPFYRALQQVYGLDRDEFWAGWQSLVFQDARWSLKK